MSPGQAPGPQDSSQQPQPARKVSGTFRRPKPQYLLGLEEFQTPFWAKPLNIHDNQRVEAEPRACCRNVGQVADLPMYWQVGNLPYAILHQSLEQTQNFCAIKPRAHALDDRRPLDPGSAVTSARTHPVGQGVRLLWARAQSRPAPAPPRGRRDGGRRRPRRRGEWY